MKTHKPRCDVAAPVMKRVFEDNSATKALHDSLNEWLTCWRPTLRDVAITAMDLPNHPGEWLAKHV